MAFAYFERLSGPEKLVYLASDSVHAVRLFDPASLVPLAARVRESLPGEEPARVQQATGALAGAMTERLGVRPVSVEVLAVRPRTRFAELHGLYSRPEAGPPRIQLWMRTARKGRVVAHKTFLRTFLHELCHHLDFELLRLPLSLHTEGFFKRESSLFHQLVPDAPRRRPAQSPRG